MKTIAPPVLRVGSALALVFLVGGLRSGVHYPWKEFYCASLFPAFQPFHTPVLIKPSPPKDTLPLEWSRQDERTVVGRLTAPVRSRVRLVHYFPWDFKGRYLV